MISNKENSYIEPATDSLEFCGPKTLVRLTQARVGKQEHINWLRLWLPVCKSAQYFEREQMSFPSNSMTSRVTSSLFVSKYLFCFSFTSCGRKLWSISQTKIGSKATDKFLSLDFARPRPRPGLNTRFTHLQP